MKNFKSHYLKKTLSMVLAVIMMITLVPLGVFAQDPAQGNTPADALSSATYYTKPNWEARIKDKSRWKAEDTQTLVRVTTSDPVRMNDIDYDGMYINANGRYVIRLIYKENTKAVSTVWKNALINFGELDQYIDFSNSYVFAVDGKTRYTFDPVKGVKGRGFDVASAAGDRTNGRKNLPINLVLKDGVTLENLPKKNYIIQMRLTDSDYKKIYAYAPGKSSVDYSSYTKTTSVSLDDNLNNLFIKGGLQDDSNNATNQEFFMSEFIANPEQFPDKSNLGIIRTQYMGQTNTIIREEVGGEPIAFTQVFDANLLKYLVKDDTLGDETVVGYVNVLTIARELSPYTQNVPIKRKDINTIQVEGNKELAYVVIGTQKYINAVAGKNPEVKVVKVPKNDQHTMISGLYITAIDYVVDKKKFEDTFSSKYTRKLDYSTMSGWTNPNKDGWPVYKMKFNNDYVVQEGDSFMVDAGKNANGKQIMIQIGGEQAILRRPQGYYNGYVFNKNALDAFEEIADGVFQFTIGEGTTVLKEKPLKIYMPYTPSDKAPDKINFLQIHNGTKKDEGAATLTLQKDRKINMHLYKKGKKGYFVLKYTKADETESSLEFKPKLTWTYEDNDGVLTGTANKATLATGGNFYINTEALKPGTDIIVESYGADGNKIDSEESRFKYIPLDRSTETVKLLTWTDHSDKRSVLSINKSLYTPYQVLFTNDYVEGNAYKDPRALPSDNNSFNTETTKIVGYTKYDGGKVRTLYEGDKLLFGKVEADGNEYDNNGELAKPDVRKTISLAKKDIFDAQFAEDSKEYKVYEYTVDLDKMLPYHSDDKNPQKLTLLKDMKFVSTASDGSSLPSDLFESRVRARVLFDANGGKLADDKEKVVKIVPDNVKFYGEDGYAANGFEGANADTNTGDKFPEAPKSGTKTFLGWVTEDGKNTLGDTTVPTAKFNALSKDQVFTNTTPVEKHLVVYAIYTNDKVVTFDANGGKFTDGKDEMTKQSSDLANVEEPTRDGYKFLGWADKKDATEANVSDPSSITESKTLYAVWEQEADKTLDLKPPTAVEVQDKNDLTAKEKEAVKDAVIAANTELGLTKDDITVGSDGKVTVTKDGKTGELTPDQTVKQKEVINNINPPKKPVEVANPDSLTDDEKGRVRDAIIAANPDLNLKPDEVKVDEKGNVTIEQGGKTGKVKADKTVVEANKILPLVKPDKVEVQDPNNLTQAEREKVKDAVVAANSGLSKDKISVDANGNVTVTDNGKTGKLEGADTVKKFDRTDKTLNKNIELTEVSDKNNLTKAEKEAVREAVKNANPDLNFKDEEIEVSNNGTVKVPMGTNPDGTTKYETIAPANTVKDDDRTKTISLKAPKVTPVENPTSLTEDEKKEVEKAVKDANTTLPSDAKIEVGNDGSVTVTSGKKIGMLAQADTVVKKLDPPEVASDEGGNIKVRPTDDRTKEVVVTYTPAGGTETSTITAKKENGEWKINPAVEGVKVDKDTGVISIPSNKIQNGSDVKAVAKDGENTSDGSKATSKDTKAPELPKINEEDNGDVTVTIPKDEDTTKVTVKYKDKNDIEQKVEITKENGTWTAPAGLGLTVADGKITIPDTNVKNGERVSAQAEDAKGNKTSEVGINKKKYAEKIEPTLPAKTTVNDPTNLTQKEKDAVKKAVTDENTFPQGTTVSVDNTGKATITYPDGSTDTISAASLVEKDTTPPSAPTVKANDDGSVTVTPPTDADTKEVSVTYTPEGSDQTITVTATKGNDNKWTLPANAPEGIKINADTGEITIPADKVKDGTEVKAVAKDANDKASEETNDSKATAKTPAAEKPTAPIVTAENDGSVKITPANDNKTTKVEVTYTPEGETNLVKVTATKGNDNKWTLPANAPEGIKINADTGEITIPADKVKDNTEVSATATDKSNNTSTPTDTSKANAKTPAAEKPTAPTVKAEDDGSVKITPANDNKTTKVEVTYTPEGETNLVKVTATKGNDNKWTLPASAPEGIKINADTGEITIPADKVKDGTEVSAVAEDGAGNKSTATDTSTAKAKYVIKAPTTAITVDNAKALTPENKKAVEDAVKQANPNLPTDAKVEVADDGKVTVKDKDDKVLGTIPAEKTVAQDNTKLAVKAPDVVEVVDPENVTPEEQEKIKEAVKTANPGLTDDDITVDNKGNVTVKKDGKEGKLTPAQTIKKASLADKYTPAYTEADAQAGSPTTITGPNFKDAQGQDTTKPTGTIYELGQNPPQGAAVDANGTVTYTPTEADKGTTVKIPVIVKYSDGSTDNIEAKITVAGQNINKPNAPTVTANNDGSVTVTPSTDANTKTLEVTYTPTGETNPVKVTATKGANGSWSLPSGVTDVSINPSTGAITIPADKVADGTAVKAVAKDSTGANSSDEASANAKTPSTTPEDKPAAPKVEAKDDGSVKVTLPTDDKAKTVEVTYTDNSGHEKKVTLTKDPATGNWKLPADAPDGLELNPTTGEVTIPAKNVKGGTPVTAVAKGDDNTSSDTAKTNAIFDSEEAFDLDSLDFSDIKPVSVGNIYQLTDSEKAAVENKVKDAINKVKPDNAAMPEIIVADDGNVTVSLPTKQRTIPQAQTVEQDETNGIAVIPAEPVIVNDPDHLTDAEKDAIKEAIKRANGGLVGKDITVADNGDVTIKDGTKSTTIPAKRTRRAMTRPLPELYYPDTTVDIGRERRIYPIGTPGYVSAAPGSIDAPRGVYVRVNPDGSISVEVSPRYSGPSMFTIRGYVYVDGVPTPISIRIRVTDDARTYRRRTRRDRYEREDENKEDEVLDTREVYTHKAYIFGYPDGSVRPNGKVTRAEAAAMLARLLDSVATASGARANFTDTPDHWYNKAINAVVARGIMKGYPDGAFRPNAPITRAEFTQMIAAIDNKAYGVAPFADVKGHWAELAIGREYAAGRISGYPDGTFKPNAPITRAEAAHILNKIFDRNYDSVSALQSQDKIKINVFNDLFTSFWGYDDMVEATNSHTFRRRSKGAVQEDWSEINR